MKLSDREARFLTALAREQNQIGCRGPAHDVLTQHVYPDVPRSGPSSIAFSYDAVPLIGILLRDFKDLQSINEFLRKDERITDPEWPWSSAEEYRAKLEQARREAPTQPTCEMSGLHFG